MDGCLPPKQEVPDHDRALPPLTRSAMRMAESFLVEDLDVNPDDPDYPRWYTRTVSLYERYLPLTEVMTRPLGSEWPGEYCELVDDTLDKIERKIKAAELTLNVRLDG